MKKYEYDHDEPDSREEDIISEDEKLDSVYLRRIRTEPVSKNEGLLYVQTDPLNIKKIHSIAGFTINRVVLVTAILALSNFCFFIACIYDFALGHLSSRASPGLKYDAANRLGYIGIMDAVFGMIFISKNPFVQRKILKRSYIDNVLCHSVVGVLVLINWTFHGMFMMILHYTKFSPQLQDKSTSGLICWMSIILMCASTTLRLVDYMGFSMLHSFWTLLILIFGSMHSWYVLGFLILPVAFWIFESIKQKYESRQCGAQITNMSIVSEQIVKIDFECKGLFFDAGQFLNIYIEDITPVDSYHPIFFSSSPSQYGKFSFHVFCNGDWSNRLYDFVEELQKDVEVQMIQTTSNKTTNRRAIKRIDYPALFFEGPFGISSLMNNDLFEYRHVLCFLDNMGSIPVQSRLNQFLYQAAKSKYELPVCLHIVWLESEDSTKCQSMQEEGANISQIKFNHFQPLLLQQNLIESSQVFFRCDMFLQNAYTIKKRRFLDLSSSRAPIPKYEETPSWININTYDCNFEKIIHEMVKKASDDESHRVAVLYSANNRITESSIRSLCGKYNGIGVSLHLHCESLSV